MYWGIRTWMSAKAVFSSGSEMSFSYSALALRKASIRGSMRESTACTSAALSVEAMRNSERRIWFSAFCIRRLLLTLAAHLSRSAAT
jgi:hypothetical protein